MSYLASCTRKAPYLLFSILLSSSIACTSPEEEEPTGCWPIDTATAGTGSIEIGSGLGEYTVFEDDQEILLERGGQGGHHIRVVTTIKDLEPGNVESILDKKNPRTRFTLLELNDEPIVKSNCPIRIPYADEDDGNGLKLIRSFSVVFPFDPDILRSYDGKTIKIRAEIIDSKQRFAMTERRFVARLPEQPNDDPFPPTKAIINDVASQ